MKALLLCTSFIVIAIFGMDIEYPPIPEDVKGILAQHTQELGNLIEFYKQLPKARLGRNIIQKDWLPDYFIKFGIQRMRNQQKLKRIIADEGFDALAVEDAYFYHIPGKSECLSDNNYIMITKKVLSKPLADNNHLTLKQTQQLWQLALRAKHYDMHPGNYIIDENGTIVIIDTDEFAMPLQNDALYNDWIQYGPRLKNGIPNDPSISFSKSLQAHKDIYDENARAFLTEKLQQREQQRLLLKKQRYPQKSRKKY